MRRLQPPRRAWIGEIRVRLWPSHWPPGLVLWTALAAQHPHRRHPDVQCVRGTRYGVQRPSCSHHQGHMAAGSSSVTDRMSDHFRPWRCPSRSLLSASDMAAFVDDARDARAPDPIYSLAGPSRLGIAKLQGSFSVWIGRHADDRQIESVKTASLATLFGRRELASPQVSHIGCHESRRGNEQGIGAMRAGRAASTTSCSC